MGCSCVRLVAFILLAVGATACAISFAAPYWVHVLGLYYEGLLGYCPSDFSFGAIKTSLDKCGWLADNDWAWEKQQKEWLYGCQALFGIGIIFLLIAVPCGCVSLCCCSHGRMARTAGSLALFAGLLCAVSLIVYGVFYEKDSKIMPFVKGDLGEYAWGYYVGIGGVILLWISSGMFLCSRDKD